MPDWIAPVLILCSAITWAVASQTYVELSERYSAFSINVIRTTLAFLFFSVMSLFFQGGLSWDSCVRYPTSKWQGLWFFVSVVSSYELGDLLFLKSARLLGVPCALSIASVYPIWIVFGQHLIEKTSFSLFQGLGLLCVSGGVILVILYAPRHFPLKSKWISERGLRHDLSVMLGVLFSVSTSLCWAINGFANAQLGKLVPMPMGNMIRSFLGAVVCIFLLKLTQPRARLLLPMTQLSRYFWVFVFESCLGATCYFYGISHSSLALGATLSSLSPVISVFLGWVLRKERLSWGRTLGVVSVVAGVAILLSL